MSARLGITRLAPEPTRPSVVRCSTFKWVGQSFNTCNQCGRASQDHLYDPPYGGSPVLFHVKEYDFWRGWYWQPVGRLIRRAAS